MLSLCNYWLSSRLTLYTFVKNNKIRSNIFSVSIFLFFYYKYNPLKQSYKIIDNFKKKSNSLYNLTLKLKNLNFFNVKSFNF